MADAKPPAAQSVSASPATPDKLISKAVPLSIALLVGGVWFGYFYSASYWTSRSAGSARHHYGSGIRLCRTELALRAVAIRRYAERTGHLPDSLAQCEQDAPRVDQWLEWATDSLDPGDDWTLERLVGGYSRPIDEPWHQSSHWPPLDPTPRSAPAATQDLFGLPIVYTRSEGPADNEAWVYSSTPLPKELEVFLRERGGIPAPSPEPFALSSLFVRDRLEYLRDKDRKASVTFCLLVGGMAVIVVATIVLLVRLRWSRPRIRGKIGIALAAIISGFALFLGWADTCATCYVISRFSSSRLSKKERLELLQNAVELGEVPEEVAATARQFIEKLPGRRR